MRKMKMPETAKPTATAAMLASNAGLMAVILCLPLLATACGQKGALHPPAAATAAPAASAAPR